MRVAEFPTRLEAILRALRRLRNSFKHLFLQATWQQKDHEIIQVAEVMARNGGG